ncbi:hypothetical protein NXW11_24800 [Bacteroides thetaiotaomicron]|nr:hypothetical protein [Bacteroides thetaiotaomicron]
MFPTWWSTTNVSPYPARACRYVWCVPDRRHDSHGRERLGGGCGGVAFLQLAPLVEKAQKMLNRTMLSNPYVLVATLLAGVAGH